MKKKLWYLLLGFAALALYLLPSPGQDAVHILPVEVVCLTADQKGVQILTDTGAAAEGKTLPDALRRLRAEAAVEVFLDTADYLLIGEGCEDLLPELMALLRPSCLVCRVRGLPQLEQVGGFLRRHPPTLTLARYRAGIRDFSTLITEGGRMRLVSSEDHSQTAECLGVYRHGAGVGAIAVR